MQQMPLSAWPRREAAAFFGALDIPFYSVSWRADVTRLRAATKRDGLSFYLSMVYEVTAALGEADAFLYKLRGDTVVRHERLSPSFTVPAPGGNFKIVSVDAVPGETRAAFCLRARAAADAQERLFPTPEQERRDDLAYLSCLPWLDLVSLTHETNLDRDDSIPRVAWGKFVPEDGRLRLTVGLQVNHRLIDGLHIGQFAEALQARLDRA